MDFPLLMLLHQLEIVISINNKFRNAFEPSSFDLLRPTLLLNTSEAAPRASPAPKPEKTNTLEYFFNLEKILTAKRNHTTYSTSWNSSFFRFLTELIKILIEKI